MTVWATRNTGAQECKLWLRKPFDIGDRPGLYKWTNCAGEPGARVVECEELDDFKKQFGRLPRTDRPMLLELVLPKKRRKR